MAYDILVIGSGPGGYIAAIRAAQLGFKTAIVEREHLGGICLNWGCIPTKSLLRSAEMKHYCDNLQDYGIVLSGEASADIAAIVARSRGVSARLNGGVAYLMKKNKIDIIWGEAKLQSQKGDLTQVEVRKMTKAVRQPQNPVPKSVLGAGLYEAKHIIIATGSRPRVLPGIEPDGKLVLTYFEAMLPQKLPKSLVIMGSGAIGIEFASFYRDMGVDVTVVELLPQILPSEDAEISAFARKALEKRGLHILTGTKVVKIEKSADSVTIYIEENGKTRTLHTEKLITAVGVQGNIENIGLETLGVKTEGNSIQIDAWCRTNIPGIYAIGDVAGAPMLAHKGEKEGVLCVEKIAGLSNAESLDKNKIPGCTYSTPNIASVGLTEQKARDSGHDIRVGRCNLSSNGKAIAKGQEQGLVKTIFDKKTGRLLGAHMAGAEVTELIQGAVIAMNLETTEEELIHSIFPHPTFSETIKESVLDAYGMALNS